MGVCAVIADGLASFSGYRAGDGQGDIFLTQLVNAGRGEIRQVDKTIIHLAAAA